MPPDTCGPRAVSAAIRRTGTAAGSTRSTRRSWRRTSSWLGWRSTEIEQAEDYVRRDLLLGALATFEQENNEAVYWLKKQLGEDEDQAPDDPAMHYRIEVILAWARVQGAGTTEEIATRSGPGRQARTEGCRTALVGAVRRRHGGAANAPGARDPRTVRRHARQPGRRAVAAAVPARLAGHRAGVHRAAARRHRRSGERAEPPPGGRRLWKPARRISARCWGGLTGSTATGTTPASTSVSAVDLGGHYLAPTAAALATAERHRQGRACRGRRADRGR